MLYKCIIFFEFLVLLQEWGNFYFNKIKEHTTPEGMLRYHLWMNEQACRELGRLTVETGRCINTFT